MCRVLTLYRKDTNEYLGKYVLRTQQDVKEVVQYWTKRGRAFGFKVRVEIREYY